MTTTQKILKVGSSLAVTIPKATVEAFSLKAGGKIVVEQDTARHRILLHPSDKIDHELVDWTNTFIAKYRPALEALAKK